MASWKITLSNGTSYSREEVTVNDYVAAAELLNGGWDTIDPANGPRELAVWVAVLESRYGNTGDDIVVCLQRIMEMPMLNVLKMMEVVSG